MRGPPCVVGDEKEGVQGETSDMVDPAVGGQSTVTSLMAEGPETSPSDTLPEPVSGPETPFGTELDPRTMGLEGGYKGVDVGRGILMDGLDLSLHYLLRNWTEILTVKMAEKKASRATYERPLRVFFSYKCFGMASWICFNVTWGIL